MKIVFINLPWWCNEPGGVLRFGVRAGSRWPFTMRAHCHPDAYAPGGYLPFPFFMAHAAAFVQRQFSEATVILRDSIALREGYEASFNWLANERPDYAIIESATPSWDHDRAAIARLVERCPDCKVIVTGTVTTIKAQEALAVSGVVAAVQGEYEHGVCDAIQGSSGVIGHHLLTREEMNRAPFPLLPVDTALHYWDACPRGHCPPQLQVWSSRGCPYRCCFCAWPATMTGNDPDGTGKRSVRIYTPEYMAAMLEDALGRFPFASIYDDSDTFNLVEKHTQAMCEVYRKTGLPWSAMCRADTVSRETWQLMRASGCFGVKIGFESGSQRVIDHIINKRLDLGEAADTARFLRSIGMTVHGTFTVGLPGETHEEMQQTVDFINSLYASGALDSHQLSGTAVIEGTPLGNLAQQGLGGRLKAYDEAVIDERFIASTDGQAKIERMTQ